MFKLIAAVAFAASLTASAQMDMKPSANQSTDKEKIADALRAGPAFITKDAAIADWPANLKDPNAEYRALRAGKSDWTCLPGIPGYSHDEPMCLDKTSMRPGDKLHAKVTVTNTGNYDGEETAHFAKRTRPKGPNWVRFFESPDERRPGVHSRARCIRRVGRAEACGPVRWIRGWP